MKCVCSSFGLLTMQMAPSIHILGTQIGPKRAFFELPVECCLFLLVLTLNSSAIKAKSVHRRLG